MKADSSMFQNKNVTAWVLMITAVLVHVLDETVSGFLPFYNNLVFDLKNDLGFFPMPTFSFGIWLGGLIIVIIVCFSLTPIVRRGGRLIRTLTTLLGILMVLNALGHIIGSIYLGRLLPGFWSSPFLLLTAVYVVVRGFSQIGSGTRRS